MTLERADLYFSAGNSDKEYHASLEEKGGLCVVNCSWGRRGGTLQTGCKTSVPVPYQQAKAFFDKLVREKTGKGYSPGQAGTPYQQTANEQRATGILPQLLNPIGEDEAKRLIDDDAFWMQPKFDGRRILIQTGSEIIGINRKGLSVALPETVVTDAKRLPVSAVIDGESCGNIYYVFDLLEINGVSLRKSSYSARLEKLESQLGNLPGSAIRLAETARNKDEKARLFARLQREKAEGVVFKRHDATYVAGRPASGGSQLKCKFYATASCIVAKTNQKRSVALELFGGDSKLVGVGNVTIPANQPVPPKGSIVETRYLYAFPKGALFQPTYLGQRDDVEPSACTTAQLKFKPDAGDEADEA